MFINHFSGGGCQKDQRWWKRSSRSRS